MDLSEKALWQAVLKRDRRYDGICFYGVMSTFIYCRFHCSSKKPLLENTRFFFSKNNLVDELKTEFKNAEINETTSELSEWPQMLVDYLAGSTPWPKLPFDVKATAFQRKVWDHLRTIPEGQTMHYSEIASAIGQPKAARAVARACATNPVALVIPCHRVVPKTGGVGGYRWGPKRKKKLLAMEKQKGII